MEIRPTHVFFDFNENVEVCIPDFVREKDIKMVYWDLGGTLVDNSETLKQKIIKKINNTCHSDVSMDLYELAMKSEWKKRENPDALKRIKSINSDEKEKEYWIEFYNCLLKSLGIQGQHPHLVKWLAKVQADPKSFELFEYVDEALAELDEMGIPVGIISNAFPSTRKILEESGLIQKFNMQHIILSYEYGSIKPEREIYRQAVKKARVKPGEVLFIDDRKSFVEGAAQSGIKAILITKGTSGQRRSNNKENKAKKT